MAKRNQQKGSKSKKNHKNQTLSKRPKHQKLEIKFDPQARRQYLTGLSAKKQERRAYGLAMQKVKDRRAKIEERKESKKAMMEQIEEAEKMKNNDLFDDYDSGDESDTVEKDEDHNVKVEKFEDQSTQQQFGGQVIVTTSFGIPSDDESVGERAQKIGKKNVDFEQKFAGNVKKYMDQFKKNMPAKKAKFQNRGRAGKKGQHGAEKMIGGNAKDLKMAQKTLSRAQGNSKNERGGKKGKKGKRR